jgi:hypothetical protein
MRYSVPFGLIMVTCLQCTATAEDPQPVPEVQSQTILALCTEIEGDISVIYRGEIRRTPIRTHQALIEGDRLVLAEGAPR